MSKKRERKEGEGRKEEGKIEIEKRERNLEKSSYRMRVIRIFCEIDIDSVSNNKREGGDEGEGKERDPKP
jgi:hypothetical protein